MKDLNYGKGYNMQQKDVSGLEYMPEGMENRDYFSWKSIVNAVNNNILCDHKC